MFCRSPPGPGSQAATSQPPGCGATVSITAGFSAADDALSFTNQNGITGSYDAATGVLTLSGNASIADYQAALRSVQFSTSDNSASPAARTVSFTVTDSVGATSTGTAQRTINVGQANQPPVLANIESGPLQYEAGTPAVAVLGRLYVDRGESVWLVLDIALLPEHRRTGIGTRLLTEILAEAAAAGKPVQIHVERFNPARHHHENPQRSESRANGRLPQSDAMPAQAIS